MSELHILDAGRADCTVSGYSQGRQTVVVDGGGKYYGARRPLLGVPHPEKYLRYRLAHPDPSAPRSLRRLCAPGRPGAGAAGCGALQRSSVCRPGVSGIWRSGVLPGVSHVFPISEPQRDRTDPVERVRRKDLYLRRLRAGLPLYPMRDSTQRSVTYAEACVRLN